MYNHGIVQWNAVLFCAQNALLKSIQLIEAFTYGAGWEGPAVAGQLLIYYGRKR